MSRQIEKLHFNQRNDLLDVMRIVAAFMVVGIHATTFRPGNITPFGSFFINYFGRLSVPFFFMITGYFSIGKMDFMEKNWFATLVKRLKRLLTIYVFWALFYLYFGIRQVLSDNSSSWYVVVIKSVFVSPPGWGPGWYILSSIASLLMISILISSGCERCALILSIVLFVFFVGLSGYNEFLPFPHGVVTLNQEFTPYTSIFAGFPWVYLGYFVRKYNLNSLSKKFQIIGLIVSMTFFIFENKLIDTFSLGTTHAFTLSLLPLSVFIFVLLTDTNNLRLEWVDSKKIANLSSAVYMLHVFVLYTLNILISVNCNSDFFIIISVILSFIVAGIFIRISEFTVLSFLKKTY